MASNRIVLATLSNRTANITMAQPAVQLDPLAADRERMVARQIAGRGVRDTRVLQAMREVHKIQSELPKDVSRRARTCG